MGQWEKKEYTNAIGIIKQIKIYRFIDFKNVFDVLIEMDDNDFKQELEILQAKNVVQIEKNGASVAELKVIVFNQVLSKMLSFTRMAITTAEKDYNKTPEEEIELYTELKREIDNKDSDYIQLFISTYEDWVENNFTNDLLKRIILSKIEILTEKKYADINQRLKTAYLRKSKQTSAPISYHTKTVKERELRKKYQ